jgi:hypothetical protein
VLGPAVILKFTMEDMNVHEAEALTVTAEGWELGRKLFDDWGDRDRQLFAIVNCSIKFHFHSKIRKPAHWRHVHIHLTSEVQN